MIDKKYTVYFEFYGRKMKTTVTAKHEIEAKQKVHERLIFHSVNEIEENKNVMDFFTDIFGIGKK